MDFTKILSAFAAIENKQTLNEAEKKETTWTDMKGNKHPATQVKGDKYTGKEAEKDEKEKAVKESVGYKPVDLAALIARMDTIAESAEKVEEDDVEEGNEFSGELAKAKAAGKKEFEVDGKKYDVKEGKKPDFLDMDKDGDKKEPMKKALKDKEKVKEADDRPASKEKETTWTDKEGKKHPGKQVQGWQSVKADKEADKEKKETMKESQLDECGDMMGGMAGGEDSSGMNVNTSMDTRTGRKTVTISAEGQSADELMQVLKLAGIAGMGGEEGHSEPEMGGEEGGEVEVELVPLAHAEGGFKMGGEEQDEKEVDETYANEPNPEVQPVDAQLRQGTDLNREKAMTKHGYKQGDNPLAMREAKELAKLEAELMEELESIKVKAY
jgi:hypothetical protein